MQYRCKDQVSKMINFAALLLIETERLVRGLDLRTKITKYLSNSQ